MRKLKNDKCSKCGYIGVYSKCLCNKCYAKSRRSTPEGKLKVKQYNDSQKAKEARARYLAKTPKPPKPPKDIKICECGETANVKDYCFRCYHKYYQRKRNGFIEGQDRRSGKRMNKFDIDKMFSDVLTEVEKGFTISKACEKLNITRNKLYAKITDKQKTELRACKAISINNIVDDYEYDNNLR